MVFTFIRGQFVPENEAYVHVSERGFRFGDGVFETICVHEGVPYQWEFHMQRLQEGLEQLRIEYDMSELIGICRALLHKNQLQQGILRICISRGQGSKGYLPALKPGAEPCVLIETQPVADDIPIKAALWLSSYSKISAPALPSHIKHMQGINSTLARMEAVENACFEALLLNAQGKLCEGSSSNIFWLKNNKLHTPALDCGVLPGSTRHAVLRLSPWQVVQGAYEVNELQKADAVVLTNTAWGVLPVNALQPMGWKWESAKVAAQLQIAVQADKQDYAKAHNENWL